MDTCTAFQGHHLGLHSFGQNVRLHGHRTGQHAQTHHMRLEGAPRHIIPCSASSNGASSNGALNGKPT